jgi:hypothetical protein
MPTPTPRFEAVRLKERVAQGEWLAPAPPQRRVDILDDKGNPWMWGQVNRVLPMKFLLRVLLNEAGGKPIGVPDAYALLGGHSRRYALHLQSLDEEAGRRRDERLSVGFPSGESEDAALRRFLSQYFADVRSDGLASGALVFLGLVGFDPQGRVGLTEQGVRFAEIENPILDEGRVDERLSRSEIQFYLRHSLDEAVGEASAFSVLLAGIRNGATTNDELSACMKSTVAASWTDTLVSTERSGAVGRMLELGLVARQREGVRVQFSATEWGLDFLRATAAR